ncbi:PAS domain S-box-containing protein [Aquimarina sp. MAR_2010_214]|uniref:PAS domain S-box protein n=1 Tax=Aquimarina sp. MAR_2010_214 TaxID=1250026 RepID=UPI000C713884|nr:PAS domain S-box protein [Aquimarina sp. MAR_2010_214]PKV49641.1 PAS domain S-box-containing protein [Aquimarina sp. MAR_2010_214]
MIRNQFDKTQDVENVEENYLKEELYALIKKDDYIFDFIQKSSLDGLWFWDLDNPENEWMNSKFWTTLGYDPDEMPHSASAWQDIINKEDLEVVFLNFTKHCKDPLHPYDQIVRYKHKLGHTVWVHCRGLAIRDRNGKPVRMLGAHTDITKLKKVEIQLQRQVERYQHIIEGTHLGTWEWNIKTGETIFNERWANITGYTLLELEPVSINTWLEASHPDDLEKSNQLLQDHFSGKTPFYECEARMKHKNGEWIWVLDRGKVVSWDSEGNPEWMIGSHQEITKSKKDLEKNKLFIQQAPSAIAMFDTDMCYLAVSQKWYEDYNITDDDIIGKSHYDIFPEIGEKWKDDHKRCLNGEVLKSEEDSFERVDGSIQWLTWELRPWYTDENKIGGILMHTADITRAKKAEISLRISEEMFRRNFENAAIGMVMLDQKGHFTKVNYKLCEILGYSNKELIKLAFKDILHPDDLAISNTSFQKLFRGEILYSNMEERCFHKDGHIVYINLSVSVIKGESDKPTYFIAQIADISHKIIARQKLQNTVGELKSIIDDISQVIIIGTDKNGLVTTFNKGAENLLGYTKDEVLLKEFPSRFLQKEELEKRGKELSLLLGREITGFEYFIALLEKEEYDAREWTHVRKDGTCFPVQITVSPIKENNEITGYLGVAVDISEIKKAEKDLKLWLTVAEDQNKRLRNFAHIVSHNLKSHSGNFEMLLDLFIQENPEIEENEIIQLFKTASENLSETIVHLNEVVLMNTSVDENLIGLNLHEAINKAIESVSAIAIETNVVINNIVESDVNILGIPAYLDSILLNFITNGIKYGSEERDSYINLRATIEREFVVLSIEDNGLGIDLKKHQAKLFGMYKTFHNNKEARGIGLFITKNQVEAIGGKIEVESIVNKGTTFKIYMKHEKN